MNFCKNCGAECEPGAVFCRHCGHKVENVQVPDKTPISPVPDPIPPVEDKKKPLSVSNSDRTIIYTIITLAIIIIAAMFILIPKYMQPKTVAVDESGNSNKDDTVAADDKDKVIEIPKVSSYEAFFSNASWTEANNSARNNGGHLVYINDQVEFDKVCSIADNRNLKVFWVGARRSPQDNWDNTCWQDGTPITYKKWLQNEPTYYAESGEDELYLMVFKVNGTWYFNDSVNNVSQYYSGRMGYIVETEE